MSKTLSTKDIIQYLKNNPESYIQSLQFNITAPLSDLPGKFITGDDKIYKKLPEPIIVNGEQETHYQISDYLRVSSVPSMYKKGILTITARIPEGHYDIIHLKLNPQ